MATFNSRYLSCKQISELFIPTQNFYKVARPCHSVLLGARGSGKTTLLKMLKPEAIKEFNANGANLIIPFYGVYIPSDRQWSFILEQLDVQNNSFYNNVSQALVNLNVLLAFLETLSYVLKEKETSIAETYNFCKILISFLKLDADTPPILDIIRVSLRRYVLELQNAVQEQNIAYEFPFVCKSKFMDIISPILDMVEIHFADKGLTNSWALCFDEMEIAPDWLQKEIINVHLRSRDQRILFKITSTPDWSISQKSLKDASVGNDIEIIKCWITEYANIGEWKEFCDTVIDNLILNKYNLTHKDLIGLIDTKLGDREYYLRELPKVDSGFEEFFKRDYDIDNKNKIVISRSSQRAKFYYWLILAKRYSHFCELAGKPCEYNKFYLGNWLLYNMSDGNPRSLFNLLNDIVSYMMVNGELKMNLPALVKLVNNYSESALNERFAYCAMPPIQVRNRTLSFRDILILIGEFFRKELLGEIYNPFPRTMFAIDEENQYRGFIHAGLEAGAIVRVDDKKQYSGRYNDGVYRLSYLLYPYFGYISTPTKDVVLISEIIKDEVYETE